MTKVNKKSIDMLVLCGHLSDDKIDINREYKTSDFFDDDGVLWFKETEKTISLSERKLLNKISSSWNLRGEDKPSEIGWVAENYLKKSPEGTEVMLLTWEGSYATRSGQESIEARFYGPSGPLAYLTFYDRVAETIKSGSKTRMANIK